MGTMDKISIVVAVYNAEKYLKKCVDSLLSQTHKNIEIILINDCSKDSSLSLCKEYSSKYDYVRTINNSINLGVSATRNKGIDASTGDYICFVDSDDYVEPDYLEVLYNNYLKYNTVPICGFFYHDECNHCEPVEYKWSGGDQLVSLGEAFKLNDELYLTALWNKLFDLELAKSRNIRFDTSISRGEDLRFTIDYVNENNLNSVYVSTDALYHYMKLTDSNLLSKIDRNIIEKSIENLQMIRDLAIKYDKDKNDLYNVKLEKLKSNFIYQIIRSKMTNKEKYDLILSFIPDYAKRDFYKAKISCFKEKLFTILHNNR